MTKPNADLSEEEIEARLAARPDLLERLKSGDTSAFAEIAAVGMDVEVREATIRSLA